MKRITLFIFLFLLVFIGWVFRSLIYQSFQSIPPMSELKETKCLVIAHRGASGYAPENTLAAFSKAMEQKVDMIELDIHLSKDGEVIVIHDETLDRTTTGKGFVHQHTLANLKKLDAGRWFGEQYANESIPTLEEVIQLVDGQTKLLIEIKWAEDFLYDGIVQKTMQLIEKYQAYNWCIIQSFESSYLEEVLAYERTVDTYHLIVSDFSPIDAYFDRSFSTGHPNSMGKYKAINPYYKSLSPDKVSRLQSEGYLVCPYTVNEEEDLKKILAIGVDGIITNYPNRLNEILGRL